MIRRWKIQQILKKNVLTSYGIFLVLSSLGIIVLGKLVSYLNLLVSIHIKSRLIFEYIMEEEILNRKWLKTKSDLNYHEQKLIETYLQFLRETAKFFLQWRKKVYFRNNQVVHWGKGGFGHLYIIGNDEDESLLPDYFLEIQIVNSGEKIKFSAKEVNLDNLEDIRYRMDEW